MLLLPTTEYLSHEERASAGKSDGSFDAQNRDKTKTLYKKILKTLMDLEPLQYLSWHNLTVFKTEPKNRLMSNVALWSGRMYYLLIDKTDHRQHRESLKS